MSILGQGVFFSCGFDHFVPNPACGTGLYIKVTVPALQQSHLNHCPKV